MNNMNHTKRIISLAFAAMLAAVTLSITSSAVPRHDAHVQLVTGEGWAAMDTRVRKGCDGLFATYAISERTDLPIPFRSTGRSTDSRDWHWVPTGRSRSMLDQVSGDIGACLAPLDRDDKIFTQPPRGGTGSGDCGEWMWRIPFSPFGEDGAEQCRAAQQKGAHWICGTVGPATGPDGTDGPYEGERTYHAPKMRVQVNGSIVSIDTDAEPAVTRTLETAKANVIYVLQEHGNQPVPLPPHARMTTGKGTVLSAVGLAGGQLTTELPDGRYCIVRRYVREDPLEGNPSPTARTRFHGLPGGYALLEDGDFDNYNLRPDMWNVPFRILFFEVGKFNPQG